MKLILSPNDFKNISSWQFLRQAGYQILESRKDDKVSFVRRLSSDLYPRFHIYLQNNQDSIIFNIHLDQKKASYQGQTAHSGEYDGELVNQEANRLKSLLKPF
jgi:hypothetical protein